MSRRFDREVTRDEYVDAFNTWGNLIFAHESEHYRRLGHEFTQVVWPVLRERLHAPGVPEYARMQVYCAILYAWERENDFKNFSSPLSIAVQKSNFLARRLYGGETRLREHRCPIHDGHWDGPASIGLRPCPYQCDGTGWLHKVPTP